MEDAELFAVGGVEETPLGLTMEGGLVGCWSWGGHIDLGGRMKWTMGGGPPGRRYGSKRRAKLCKFWG